MKRYAEVAFNLPLKKSFTYLLPEDMDALPGCRVAAPFGSRSLVGCVVALRDSPPAGIADVKEVRRLIDAHPLFGEETLEIARWMSGHYLCSLGEAIFTMLPGGRRESSPR